MFRRVIRGVFSASAMAVLFGCTTLDTRSVSASGFSNGNQTATVQARVLEAGDGIEVSVEVDGNMEVALHRAELNHQGVVTLPLVGDVKVSGMKLAEARSAIAKTYGAYYVDPPVIMLTLMDSDMIGEWGFVTVLGRVSKPGRVPLQSQSGMNLSAAIQAAGGFAPSAKQSDIRVTRVGTDGKKQKVSVDFEEIGESGNAEADIVLIDGDIIYVPERIF